MGENLNPLDELKNLDQQVDRVTELEGLKPIFFRLDEIAKANVNDFEIQLVVGDIKQRLVNRGNKLKDLVGGSAPPTFKPQGAPAGPPIPPPLPPTMQARPPVLGVPPPAPPGPPSNIQPPSIQQGSSQQGSVSPDAPTVKLTRPPVSGGPPSPPPLRSPLDNPVAPPEVKPPVRLMSSGQFSTPKPPPTVPPAATPPGPPPGPPPIGAEPPKPRTIKIPQPAAQPSAAQPSASQPPPVQPSAGPPSGAPISAPQIPKTQAPGPTIPAPQATTPPMPGASFGSSARPLATGPQAPPGIGAPPPTIPPSRPPATPSGPGGAPPKSPKSWKQPLLMGALIGALLAVAGIAFLVNQARKHNKLFESKQAAESAGVQVQIATTPPNASIRVNGETKCNSPCAVALPPGSYQVMAFLDGYDPATSSVDVAAGQTPSVNLALTPQPQSVRILTDLDQGKIAFDDQPPADLQEGQFILDKVAPGPHTIKVTGKSGDATFTFDVAEAKPPAVTGSVTARNLIAVLVSSIGSRARVVTNSGPMKLAVNGQPEEDAGPAGVDLKAFQPGVDELVIGEGKDQRNMKESFGPAPMLTAFLKSDLNIGTLIVSTNQDDVRVFLNDKEYKRRTQRGQLRIPAIGSVKVWVSKDGFQVESPQIADVKKGAEVRLEFKMKPTPVVTTLQIRGGTPGSEVLIDQSSIGTVGADGTFTNNNVMPGDHVIELRRDQFVTRRIQRNFRVGQPVALNGPEATLASATPTNATIRIARTPANATVTYRRADETESRELRAPQVELSPGNYIFSARAPGFTDRTERVQVASGESRTIEIALAARPSTAPAPKLGNITDFEEAGAWKQEGDLFVHKGGGFVPYKLGPRGVYTFTVELVKGGGVFRGGRIRWAVQYLDSKNYLLFELDRKTFWASVVEKGKKLERQKTPHQLENQKAFTIQMEITPDHVLHRLKTGDSWLTLDSFAEPGRNFTAGKFGFLIQGADEIGVSTFMYSPQ